jgi:hypothetical protein
VVALMEPSTTSSPQLAANAVPLVMAGPGTGKTYSVQHALARRGTRAVFVIPTHDLAGQVQRDLEGLGVSTHYWRQGPNDEDECPERELVEFFRGLGYVIRWGPCLECPKRRKCTYRRVFTCRANQSAQVLIVTSWHLRRSDLWRLKALKRRPLVVMDEDALSALAAPVELSIDRLRNFVANLQVVRDALGGGGSADAAVAWLTRRQVKPADGDPASLALTDIFRRAAESILRACATAVDGIWRPSEAVLDSVLTDYDQGLLADHEVFSRLVRCAYDAARRRTMLPNVLADLRDLLAEPRPVHLSVGACRWTHRSVIPVGREVLMLDASAEPKVVEGVVGRPVQVIDTPPIEQKATIFQIMDKVGTRAGNRRDLDREESWTAKLVTEVGRRHRGQSLLAVTFKPDTERIEKLLEREHGNATVIHYGALRGLNAFQKFDTGLIIGRPMPNEASLQLLAVAAFGPEALDEHLRSPPLEWALRTVQIGPDTWTVRCQQYADERWQAVWRHVVVGELTQAIGRLRPLTNPATIYIACNEPLPLALDVTAVYAAELFPDMGPSSRRSDFQQRVRQYAAAMQELIDAELEPTNLAVCQRLGLKQPNGLRYRNLAVDALAAGVA